MHCQQKRWPHKVAVLFLRTSKHNVHFCTDGGGTGGEGATPVVVNNSPPCISSASVLDKFVQKGGNTTEMEGRE